jgi:MFS family permease
VTWLSADARHVLAARGLRAFAYGFLSVLLGLYLAELGFGAVALGGVLSATLVGSAVLTVAFSGSADRLGRRRLLQFSALLMAASGLTFAVAPSYAALVLAALSGTVATSSGEVGPFLSLEQAVLPQTVDEHHRNRVFGLYNSIGAATGAVGALAAGLPTLLTTAFAVPSLDGYRAMLLVYAAVGLLTLLLFAGLSERVELQVEVRPRRVFAIHRSRGTVLRLSALFGLDALAGGFLLQSMAALWFNVRYGADATVLGPMFAVVGLLQAVSYVLAARLADRFGLINTMVWTHLPSNVLLMLVPLAPTLPVAMAFYILRHALSQMDVPARQSYTVAVVEPDERAAAAGFTNVARMLGSATTPALSGMAMQTLALGLPFFVTGGMKIVYDLLLYAAFRGMPAPEETRRSS